MLELLTSWTLTLIYGLGLIGVLVVVHEAGHFVAAKIFGVGVPVFSVGMGPRLFGFVWRGTDYRISALPIGGYVQMSGADPFGEEDTTQAVDPEEDFMRKPVWQRLIIMAAGPGVNLALPFVIFTVLFMLGRPDIASQMGTVIPDSPAVTAGFVDEDTIVAFDGQPVQLWHDVEMLATARLQSGDTSAIPVVVERDDREVTLQIPAEALGLNVHDAPDFTAFGIAVSRSGQKRMPVRMSTFVGVEAADSPAGRAGLLTGDRIVEVDGEPVETWQQLVTSLSGPIHELEVSRLEDDERVTRELTLSLEGGAYASPAPVYDNPWGLLPVNLFAGRVSEDDPAGKAGLASGDRFATVDGMAVYSFDHLIELVSRSLDGTDQPRTIAIEMVRDGAIEAMTVTPIKKVIDGEPYARAIIGVTSMEGVWLGISTARKYYGFGEAVQRAGEEGMDVLKGTVAVLGNVLTGASDASKNVGGPIAMVQLASLVAERSLFDYAAMIGMISVSLGVINLLPVPVLDGGQILFYAVEGIRGRPLSLELRERLQMAGVLALSIVMLLVFVNDINRWAGG